MKNGSTTNTTQINDSRKGLVGVIRYAAHNPREVMGELMVVKGNRTYTEWPLSRLDESGENERVDKLARKVLGCCVEGAKYAAVKGSYVHRTDGPTIVLTDEHPTHVFFIADRGLRAYGGVNGYDVINVAEDCHIVAIPLSKAELAVKNLVFA